MPPALDSSPDTVISLFSGAGGLSKGFALAGCKPVAGAEIDRDARATYEANLGIPCLGLDLSAVTPAELRQSMGIGRAPFAIVGGPPCQGFSSAGMRDGADPRNRLIFNYLHIVEELRPRWFLFENVEGLLTANGGQSIFQLAQKFLALGYWIRIEKINFAAVGVPQSRKRVLIVGNRLGLDFRLPEPTHSYDSGKHRWSSSLPPSPTLLEATNGLGKATPSRTKDAKYSSANPVNEYDARMRAGNSSECVTLHFVPAMSAQDMERASRLKPGQTMKDLPEELWHESYRRRAFRRVQDGTPTEQRGGAPSGLKRLRGDLNSLTITGSASSEFIHPTEDRPLSLRECARLQSFEDAYQFTGSARSIAQQIGNAVPPLGAEVFARSISSIDGLFGSGRVVQMRAGEPRLLGFRLTDSSGMSPALMQTHSLLQSLVDDLGLLSQEAPIAARQAT